MWNCLGGLREREISRIIPRFLAFRNWMIDYANHRERDF